MKSERQYRGFSLTEVLLAVGTFAIGMIFVAGVFPVAIHFTTVATERTIAAVVADEAFAKVRLIAGDPAYPISASAFDYSNLESFEEKVNTIRAAGGASPINPNKFAYPSTNPLTEKHYYWSALCRRVDPNSQLVQVTVFISRKVGAGTKYWYRKPDDTLMDDAPYPVPVRVNVSATPNLDELLINFVNPIEKTFINDGYTIVENMTGEIYRVLERYADTPDMIELDRPWQGGDLVWVVPPPIGGGRYPCIAIYQKVIRF